MIDVKKIKEDFPIFENYKKDTGHELVYLDNAASSQTPRQTVEAMDDYYFKHRSNIHRGGYKLGEDATNSYENARVNIARFIGADSSEVIFTGGATVSSNMLVYALEATIDWKKGDSITTTIAEHHSNLVPLQELARRKKVGLKYFNITDDFRLDLSNLDKIIDKKTKIVSLALVSNVLGTVHEVSSIINRARSVGAYVILDATKAVGHIPVDVKQLDCDFLFFSGHKMCGPTGIGILYGKKEILEKMNPSFFGGGIVEHVTMEEAMYAHSPSRFEPGTPNIAGAIGLSRAVDYLEAIGIKNIEKHSQDLVDYAIRKLCLVPGVKLVCELEPKRNVGIISVIVEGIHPHDLSEVLDRDHVAVRGGHHCAMPLMGAIGTVAVSRASFYFYNTESDVDAFIGGIKKAQEMFNYFTPIIHKN